jgi:nucleoside-diphosphate-sugar epimerase
MLLHFFSMFQDALHWLFTAASRVTVSHSTCVPPPPRGIVVVVVGPSVVAPSVVGPSVVAPGVVGPSVVGPGVVGPSVVGPSVVGPSACRRSLAKKMAPSAASNTRPLCVFRDAEQSRLPSPSFTQEIRRRRRLWVRPPPPPPPTPQRGGILCILNSLQSPVTNSRSYVGRWLALELSCACPQATVVAFDISTPSTLRFADLFDDVELDIRSSGALLRSALNRVQVFKGSILSLADLNEAFHSCDVVFNTAAYGMASVNGASLSMCRSINVTGAAVLLHACKACSVRRIVHVSSTVAVFDGSPITNGSDRLPLVTDPRHCNHYGATKALAEQLLRQAGDGVHVVIVRPNGIFGPNDNTHFPRLKRLLHGGMFNLKVGDGASLVDWIFIDNLTHALLLAAAVPFPSSAGNDSSSSSSKCLTVHVSDEDPREMNHLFCSFAEGLGYRPPTLHIPTRLLYHIAAAMVTVSQLTGGWITPMLTPSEALKAGTQMVFRTDDARALLGWRPVVTYDTGIKMTLEYEYRKLLRSSSPQLDVPSVVWWVLIVAGMWLCWIGDAAAAAATAANSSGGGCGLPSMLCGMVVFGSKAAASLNITLRLVFYCAVVAHVVEAAVALKLMLKMKTLSRSRFPANGKQGGRLFDWSAGLIFAYCVQTFVLGFPSLKNVLRYNRLQQAMLQSGVASREARGKALV